MDSYWELYLAYIRHCEKLNEKYDIDPHHYEMEWNHTLPKCIFGEQPLGQWLTLHQHAIASALQTLVFNKNCLCGWHKKYLPDGLLTLAWPIYRRERKVAGRTSQEKGLGIFSEEFRQSPKNRPGDAAITQKRLGIGIYDPEYRNSNQFKEDSAKGGRKGSYVTNSTLWMDPDHPELGQHNPGVLAIKQKKMGYPHSRENRIKVN